MGGEIEKSIKHTQILQLLEQLLCAVDQHAAALQLKQIVAFAHADAVICALEMQLAGRAAAAVVGVYAPLQQFRLPACKD